jgi:hypothetical protein
MEMSFGRGSSSLPVMESDSPSRRSSISSLTSSSSASFGPSSFGMNTYTPLHRPLIPNDNYDDGNSDTTDIESSISSRGSSVHVVRVSECCDFAWSRELHAKAGKRTAKIAAGLFIVYVAGFAGVTAERHIGGVADVLYFMVSTLTTIGLGDIAPRTKVGRAFSCVLLPLGLVILGFAFAAAVQLARSIPRGRYTAPPLAVARKLSRMVRARTTSSETLAAWHEKLERAWRTHPRARRALFLVGQFYGALLLGACVIHGCFGPGAFAHCNTFTDALYFAMVLGTTVGFGKRIVPATDAAKWFLIFFMVGSTCLAGRVIREFSVRLRLQLFTQPLTLIYPNSALAALA